MRQAEENKEMAFIHSTKSESEVPECFLRRIAFPHFTTHTDIRWKEHILMKQEILHQLPRLCSFRMMQAVRGMKNHPAKISNRITILIYIHFAFICISQNIKTRPIMYPTFWHSQFLHTKIVLWLQSIRPKLNGVCSFWIKYSASLC